MTSLRPIKPRPVFWLFTNFIIIMAIMTAVILVLNRIACAQSDEQTALALAQCLVAECDRCDRGEEKAAIAWVLWKGMERYNANPRNKKKRTYRDQIHAYCAVFDRRSKYYYGERARKIRASTISVSEFTTQNEWEELVSYARGVLRSKRPIRPMVPDPYPASTHFGGAGDIQIAKKKGLKILGKYCNKRGKWCTYIFG